MRTGPLIYTYDFSLSFMSMIEFPLFIISNIILASFIFRDIHFDDKFANNPQLVKD